MRNTTAKLLRKTREDDPRPVRYSKATGLPVPRGNWQREKKKEWKGLNWLERTKLRINLKKEAV